MKPKEPRINESITSREVRLIGADGKQVGVVTREKALELADIAELDLVEIAPLIQPPVCKIINYGKYKYSISKKERDAKKKQKVIQIKEIKFRPKCEEHDFQFKLNHIKRFIKEKDKVKVTMQFRGREMIHAEFGRKILDRIVEELKDDVIVEKTPGMEGYYMIMVLAPIMKH